MDCGLDGLTFKCPSYVRPEHAAEADLKNIVQRFMRTGELPAMCTKQPITSVEQLPVSFEQMMNSTTRVRQLFDIQPLEVRNKFNNDPELWLASFAKEKKPDEVALPVEPVGSPVDTVSDTGVDTGADTGAVKADEVAG